MLQISRFSILCLLLLIFGCESKNSSAKEYVIKGQAEGIYNGVRVYLKTSEGWPKFSGNRYSHCG
jgi:hypothetical protein